MSGCRRKCPNSIEIYSTEKVSSSRDISRPSILSSVVSTALPVIAEMATDKAVNALTNAFSNSFSISNTSRNRNTNQTETDCKFSLHCTRADCKFKHPMCRFDTRCTRDGCSYQHSDGKRTPYGSTSSSVTSPGTRSVTRSVTKLECRNGEDCVFKKKGTCKFYHPEDESDDLTD